MRGFGLKRGFQIQKPYEMTMDHNQNSVEATVETSLEGGGTESTCNNKNSNSSGSNSTAVTSDGEREKTLEYADELMGKGLKAAKEGDYGEASDCYSRALEIRTAHFGELAPECIHTYYKYGYALLYKAQEEADPLGAVPKKDSESQQNSNKVGSLKSSINGESSIASVSSNVDEGGSSSNKEKAPEGEDRNQGEDSEESDTEELAEGNEDDETDLDLAWKMLDVARAIAEKNPGNSMEKVDILSALAEVALEREDIETSLGDYLKALFMLEHLVEPDSRHIAELNFRICLCLEIGSKPQEAIPYCQKAISICKSRVQRLTEEVKSQSGSVATSTASELDQGVQLSSSSSSVGSLADKEAEIETLNGLAGELEKKLEDLQQLVSNPSSIFTDILGMVAARARGAENPETSVALSSSQMGIANSSGGIESPTVSTAHTTNGSTGVTHLGVVGRGVKRVNMSSGSTEQVPAKKPSIDPSPNSGDGSTS